MRVFLALFLLSGLAAADEKLPDAVSADDVWRIRYALDAVAKAELAKAVTESQFKAASSAMDAVRASIFAKYKANPATDDIKLPSEVGEPAPIIRNVRKPVEAPKPKAPVKPAGK